MAPCKPLLVRYLQHRSAGDVKAYRLRSKVSRSGQLTALAPDSTLASCFTVSGRQDGENRDSDASACIYSCFLIFATFPSSYSCCTPSGQQASSSLLSSPSCCSFGPEQQLQQQQRPAPRRSRIHTDVALHENDANDASNNHDVSSTPLSVFNRCKADAKTPNERIEA
jgi:hypothetical protein